MSYVLRDSHEVFIYLLALFTGTIFGIWLTRTIEEGLKERKNHNGRIH